jgi:uncharacterized protein YwgA
LIKEQLKDNLIRRNQKIEADKKFTITHFGPEEPPCGYYEDIKKAQQSEVRSAIQS